MAINDPTTNFGWNLPNVGGDTDAWGDILNELIGGDGVGGNDEGIDKVLGDVKTTADAALPKAGGVMTGRVDMHSAAWDLVDLGSISSPTDLDLALGNFFYATVTGGSFGFTFSNVPADAVFFVLELTNGGAGTILWPAAVKWPGGTAPTLQASGVDVLVFYTRDGGTTIRGALAMADSS